MVNAGQDDVDRALAAAGVPAMRYFNFRNLRFVRGAAAEPVETFGVNASDRDLHEIKPPGLERTEAPPPVPTETPRPEQVVPAAATVDARQGGHVEPHFGYEPRPAEAVPPPEPVFHEPTPIEPPLPDPAPDLGEVGQPVVAHEVEPVPEIALPKTPEQPAAVVQEPPPVELPVELPVVIPLPQPVLRAVVPPEPPPPSPEPTVIVAAASAPAPAAIPVAVAQAGPEPTRNPDPPPAPPRPLVRESPSRTVETAAPVFDAEPVVSVAAPVAAAEPAVGRPVGSIESERESLTQMFAALADRAGPRPLAPNWATPELPPDIPAPTAAVPEPVPSPASGTLNTEFRMSDFRMSDRSPAAPMRPAEPAGPDRAAMAVFGLADRLATRPAAEATRSVSRFNHGESPPSATEDAPRRPAGATPSPFRRPGADPKPTSAVADESLFRRL